VKLNKAQSKRWRKWIKALKSGEYVQTNGLLHSPEGGMCCLGVACDLFLDDDWVLTNDYDSERYGLGTIGKLRYTLESSGAPRELQKMMGFTGYSGFEVRVDSNICYTNYKAIASINDDYFDKNKKDYSNVLPYIIEYYNEHKHPDEPMVKK